MLASAVLINVYVYRKWKYEKRMLKISRQDMRVGQTQRVRQANDYGEDDRDDVGSEKRQYSEDERSRYSDDLSKHSEKQSEI